MIKKTIFEKITNKEIPAEIIYEDNDFMAFLSIAPFELGHTLVIPKKTYPTIFDMPTEEYAKMYLVVHKIAMRMKDILVCDMNIIQNNGPFSEREIDHVHVHLVPRTKVKKMFYLDNNDEYAEGEISQWKEKLSMMND